ncbi:MAG: DUF364 domain-containing protein [Candidatus Ozemobacteraceae bacterium]
MRKKKVSRNSESLRFRLANSSLLFNTVAIFLGFLLEATILEGIFPAQGAALNLTASLGKGKNVVVVGHFPDMERIRESARSFRILEKRPQPGDLCLSLRGVNTQFVDKQYCSGGNKS